MGTSHCVLGSWGHHTALFTLYTLYTLLYVTVFTLQCTLCSVHHNCQCSAQCSAQCIAQCSVQCSAQCSVQCSGAVHSAVYSAVVQCTVQCGELTCRAGGEGLHNARGWIPQKTVWEHTAPRRTGQGRAVQCCVKHCTGCTICVLYSAVLCKALYILTVQCEYFTVQCSSVQWEFKV